MTAIEQKYSELGGSSGLLGDSLNTESPTGDGVGAFRSFQHGVIYWHPEIGAHEVHGSILELWLELGAEAGFLGYPITDEARCPDKVGRFNHFQYGSIYWSPSTEAVEVHGGIRAKWASLGWEAGILGYPIENESGTPDGIGRFSHFQFGSIYWTPKTGACEVHGDIRELWKSLGWERSGLGYPTSDEYPAEDERRANAFQYGIIYWHPARGAWVEYPKHRSTEADDGREGCEVEVEIVDVDVVRFSAKKDIGRLFPEWVSVEPNNRVAILEGKVIGPDEGQEGPKVSFEDWPSSHYTHDFCFKVAPDPGYQNLLGIKVDPDTLQDKPSDEQQQFIEIEWETGLGASNDANPLKEVNCRGDSGGFFSQGHTRREVIWNWPTIDDRVHIEGLWIWDRGHPPANTEIHPPRFIAIERALPVGLGWNPLGVTSDWPPNRQVLCTRVNMFASGDGGALRNNRPGSADFVEGVDMSDRDYSFSAYHSLPRPGPDSPLGWKVVIHEGDTYPGDVEISPLTAPDGRTGIQVFIGWKRDGLPNDAVLARTIYLYWDEGAGVPSDYPGRAFSVDLQKILVVNNLEPAADGEFRVFVEAGGWWYFVNEMPGDDDILNGGLGDTGDDGEPWTIGKKVVLCVPPGGRFRVHGGGWEADGVNDAFGILISPNSDCPTITNWALNNLFTKTVLLNGADDDPIGEVNQVFDEQVGFGVGSLISEPSEGSQKEGIAPFGLQDTNPTDVFRLVFQITEFETPFWKG